MDSLNKNPQTYGIFAALGVILITVLFISYNNFSQSTDLGTGGPDKSLLEQIKEKLTGKSDEGEISDIAAATVRDGTEEVAGTSTENNSMSKWVATDYQQGDISTGTYTVKSGDTLWEIAEAVYGDGSQWNKILEANKASVGFLPNGKQALIVTGQSLIIP